MFDILIKLENFKTKISEKYFFSRNYQYKIVVKQVLAARLAVQVK